MNKKDFSQALHRLLSDLPWADVVSSAEFYEEMIADRMEEGLSEEEAVAQVGSPAQIAARIRLEMPEKPAPEPSEREKPQRGALFWTLLIVGSVVWLPLLGAAVAVAVSLLAAAFSVFVSLWAVVIALGGASLAWLCAALLSALQHNLLSAGMLCGLSLFGAGLCILAVFFCRFLTKKVFGWTKNGVKKVLDRIRERRGSK